MAKDILVATYGSLRHGMGNFRVNGHANADFVGTGKTVQNANLYPYGGGSFPAISLTNDSNGKPVVVEVFRCDENGLKTYDMLEGYRGNDQHNFYNRSIIPVLLDNGDTVDAWIYHIDDYSNDIIVESGDWVDYMTKTRLR